MAINTAIWDRDQANITADLPTSVQHFRNGVLLLTFDAMVDDSEVGHEMGEVGFTFKNAMKCVARRVLFPGSIPRDGDILVVNTKRWRVGPVSISPDNVMLTANCQQETP